MTSPGNIDLEVKNDPRDDIARYNENIEQDITPARKLLEEYSKIPPERVIDHIHTVVCYKIQIPQCPFLFHDQNTFFSSYFPHRPH